MQRILQQLDEPPPEGFAQWNGRLLAEALGDVSDDYVWRVLRQHRISLERRQSWCISTDPEFARKAADIVGLYLAPPENAVVICMDEKPHIQALERSQGWLKLPNDRTLSGFSHEYRRHGTTTLFAALTVATGMVKAGHFNRRRRREFLQFMNELIAEYPQQEIHVILDNLSTHNAFRTTYDDDDLPGQVLILYRPHPLAGQQVRVTQRRRHGHQTYWRVVLPDGSRAELPATWTDQPTTEFACFARESAESLATPQALRDLLTVVEPLVDSYQLREPCPEDLSGGGSDGQAAGIVRTRGSLGAAAVADDPSGDQGVRGGGAGPNGQSRARQGEDRAQEGRR